MRCKLKTNFGFVIFSWWEYLLFSAYVNELIEVAVTRRKSLATYKSAKEDARHVIGDVPEAVSSSFKAFNKDDLIQRHKSRFSKK